MMTDDNIALTRIPGYDPREEKLPRWAHELLQAARNRASRAEKRLAAREQAVEPTNIWYGEFDHPIYVPNDSGFRTVHFQMPGEGKRFAPGENDSYEGIQVRHSRTGPGIEINGGHSMSIELTSSNWIDVRLR